MSAELRIPWDILRGKVKDNESQKATLDLELNHGESLGSFWYMYRETWARCCIYMCYIVDYDCRLYVCSHICRLYFLQDKLL